MMANSKNPLDVSIEALYEAFEIYPLEANFVDRCSPLGDRQEIARRLTSQPLQQTKLEDVAIYAFKAMRTMGDERDFRYFLPRICELLATNPEWFGRDTNVFRKLAELKWQGWPEKEQTAIRQFLEVLWGQILENYPWYQTAHEFLEEITEAMDDLTPFLVIWEQSSSKPAIRHLAAGVMEVYEGSVPDVVKLWLLTDQIKRQLEEAFFEFQDEAFSGEISQAVDYLG